MAFPNSVPNRLGVSLPGEVVEAHSSYYVSKPFATEDASCVIGGFVRAGTSEALCKNGANAGEVLGIIVRDTYLTGNTAGMTLPQGFNATVALHGVIAIAAPAAAAYGQNVFVNDTTGAVTFVDGTTAEGATLTGWTVKQGCEANGIAFVMK